MVFSASDCPSLPHHHLAFLSFTIISKLYNMFILDLAGAPDVQRGGLTASPRPSLVALGFNFHHLGVDRRLVFTLTSLLSDDIISWVWARDFGDPLLMRLILPRSSSAISFSPLISFSYLRIGKLENLQALGLNENSLTNIPKEIGQLRNLTMLDMRYNRSAPDYSSTV